jgi:hypothetical protein
VSLVSDLAAFIRPGGIAGKGPSLMTIRTQLMTILSALRDRFSPSFSSESVRDRDASAGGAGDRDALPFAGYDRLDAKQVKRALSDRSQIELETVESYERSHKDRGPVLDKLRYMRQREPFAGYDALSAEEIVTALKEADRATIKKVRGYERKFANRPDVLEEVARAHQAAQPASVAPAYQPISATAGRDRTERDGRP